MFTVTLCTSICFVAAVKSQDFTSLIDVESLSELPLESLLNLRKNILLFEENDTTLSEGTDFISDGNVPQALPLIGNHKIRTKDGYYVQYGDEGIKNYDKKKNITTIFQLSVTTLAFLAFGGYLLYLVIYAIKGKNYNYMYDPNATQVMSAMINAELDRIRRRKRRPIRVSGNGGHFGYKQGSNRKTRVKNHKNVRNKRDASDRNINSEMLYTALIDLCEGYSKFYEHGSAMTRFVPK